MPPKNDADLAGCDLIIEAVFEDRELKAKVSSAAQAVVGPDAVIASNTSTLPISGLATAVPDQTKFIGLHFFSPVEKMPLVEIIKGVRTSDETLARGFDFVLQIKKTPIVVNDSRGFFTSRVFGTFTNEGIAMLGEGVSAPMIETEARKAGMPVGPLAISDEVSLSLMSHIREQTAKDLRAEGKTLIEHPAFAVIDLLLKEYKRPGKAAGGGFYDYPATGQKHLWPELKTHFEKADGQISPKDIRDRLLFVQAIETVRCMEEGVLTSTADANVGSIFGIGFAAWTGGALQFINQYGVKDFVARAQYLAEQYGERFTPPALLLEKAAKKTRCSKGPMTRSRACLATVFQGRLWGVHYSLHVSGIFLCRYASAFWKPTSCVRNWSINIRVTGRCSSVCFSQQPIAAEFTVYNVMQGDYPSDDLTFDAYLVTGSKADSFGTDPWIQTLKTYLLKRYERGDKLLGVCFGHQLLALLLGGKSERATQGWGVGTHNYKLAAKAPWMSPLREELTLLISHQDQVTALPEKRYGHRLERFLPVRRVPHQRSSAVLPGGIRSSSTITHAHCWIFVRKRWVSRFIRKVWRVLNTSITALPSQSG